MVKKANMNNNNNIAKEKKINHLLTSSTSAQEPSIRKRTFIGGSVIIAFISVTIDFNSIPNLTFNVVTRIFTL